MRPDLWPQNSPDLNLVDYKIWAIMQDRVYDRKITSVDKLKQHISDELDTIDQQLIDSAIKQWHKRLAACVSARGGHQQYMLQSKVQTDQQSTAVVRTFCICCLC